ncbi:MAG: hypothetical protein H6581_03885 [Bacteroidia bacterium]|nr:hypothetical protein [Bacteroidia bacterium]
MFAPYYPAEKEYQSNYATNLSQEEDLPSMAPPKFGFETTPFQSSAVQMKEDGGTSWWDSMVETMIPGWNPPQNEGKGSGEKEGSGEAKFTSANVEAAKARMKELNIGEEAILQLQDELGIRQTGVYDTDTVQAVYQKQVDLNQGEHFKISEDGVADRLFFRWLGLVFTEVIEPGKIMPEFAKQFLDDQGWPKASFLKGITMGAYTHYDDQSPNNKTFAAMANPWAAHHQAISLNENGELVVGKPVKIQEVGDVIEAVQSITRGLENMWAWGTLKGWIKYKPEYGADNPPPWIKVKNLAIFAHGMTYGIGMNANGSYKDGLLSNTPNNGQYKKTSANVESFAKGLDGAISSEVRVQLFSCNAGREYDPNDPYLDANFKDHRALPDENEQMEGPNSFASMLQQALGEDSSVYGHLTEGHTTNNYASVVYGKDAGGGCLHIFELLYGSAYLDAQLRALFPDKTPEELEILRPLLREEMWSHYKDSISDEHLRQAGKTQAKKSDGSGYRQLGEKKYADDVPDLGSDMFTNQDETRSLMRDNFEQVWMTSDRIKKLEKALNKKK